MINPNESKETEEKIVKSETFGSHSSVNKRFDINLPDHFVL
jgi:hypothetical protein